MLSCFPNIFLFWFSFYLSGWSSWISFKHYSFSLPFKYFSSSRCHLQSSFHFAHACWAIISTLKISSFWPRSVYPPAHWTSPSECAPGISNSICPTRHYSSSHPQTHSSFKTVPCWKAPPSSQHPKQTPPSAPPVPVLPSHVQAAASSSTSLSCSTSHFFFPTPLPQSHPRPESPAFLHHSLWQSQGGLTPLSTSPPPLVIEFPVFSWAHGHSE